MKALGESEIDYNYFHGIKTKESENFTFNYIIQYILYITHTDSNT